MAKRAADRRAAQRRGRRPIDKVPGWRRPWALACAAGTTAAIVVVGVIVLVSGTSKPPAAAIPSSLPDLAQVDTAASGRPVGVLQCQSTEQLRFHFHAHLAVFVGRQARGIPAGIGIAPPRAQTLLPQPYVNSGSCIYWLHTHTGDGVIHIEAPTPLNFTLGKFFDLWHQPLSTTQVGPANGQVIVYVDGNRFTGDPRNIPLQQHTLIQLDVGGDVPPQPFTFPTGL